MHNQDDFTGKRVLITGASGFIGQHLMHRLRDCGASISTIGRNPASFPPDVNQYPIDIRDAGSVNSCLTACKPEYIFHLAAYKEREESVQAFYTSIETNLIGSLNLFTAARNADSARSIVILGTAEEYGNDAPPFQEEARECPVTPYSFSKACVSHLGELFFRLYQIPVVTIRPTLAYGPGQGQDMFLPALITTLHEGRPFAMTAGEQTRDFIYVSDLIEAIILACGKEPLHGQILNIGSGTPVKLAQIATMIERMMQKQGLVRLGERPYRKNEMMDYAVSLEKAGRLLGWRPRIPLKEGLRRTIGYYTGERQV